MKRSIRCLLFVFGFAAATLPAAAQEVAAPAPSAPVVAIDSATIMLLAPVTLVRSTPVSGAAATGIGVTPVLHTRADALQAQAEQGGIKNFFFGTKRRTSNTLMIGGAAVVGIGMGVVKGEIGAVLGVLGLVSSVGGLYLAF